MENPTESDDELQVQVVELQQKMEMAERAGPLTEKRRNFMIYKP